MKEYFYTKRHDHDARYFFDVDKLGATQSRSIFFSTRENRLMIEFKLGSRADIDGWSKEYKLNDIFPIIFHCLSLKKKLLEER